MKVDVKQLHDAPPPLTSGRVSREVGGVHPVRPVPSVLWSGLWTAVPRLTGEQEDSQRHQEALGEVSFLRGFIFNLYTLIQLFVTISNHF